MIRAAEGLTGALARAYDAVLKMDRAELEKIGSVFTHNADRAKDYFRTSRELPTGYDRVEMAKFLRQKHDVPLEIGTQYIGRPDRRDLVSRTPTSIASMDERIGAKYSDDLGLLRSGVHKNPGAGVSMNADVWSADTMSLGRDGAAKKLYPAMWEFILAQPDAVNATEALTQSNEFRRTANMAGLYEKHGPRANRVIIDKAQLTPEFDGTDSAVRAFHALPPDAQVGALNAIIASRAAGTVNKTWGTLGALYDNARLAETNGLSRESRKLVDAKNSALYQRGRELGLEPGKPWQPTTDLSNQRYFQDLATWLHEAEGAHFGAPPVGESSLRRAAITNDALQGLQGGDLAAQPWLTRALGHAGGGRVTRRSGALSRTCGCGD